jgi:hypothetical protein
MINRTASLIVASNNKASTLTTTHQDNTTYIIFPNNKAIGLAALASNYTNTINYQNYTPETLHYTINNK